MRRLTIAALFALTLAAGCSGTSSLEPAGGNAGGGGGIIKTYSMGNGNGTAFQTGVIGLSNANLPAGGSATLSVTIVDETGTLYAVAPVTVTFSSSCITQKLATLVAAGTSTPGPTADTVITTTGSLTATYTAAGCSGADLITASATVDKQSLTATGTITVAAAAMGAGGGITFQPGVMEVSTAQLTSGGTARLTATILDESGAPHTASPVTVTFHSPCIAQGLAAISASGTNRDGPTPASVVTTTGRIDATYTANGCSGADLISAAAVVAGKTLTATGTVMDPSSR